MEKGRIFNKMKKYLFNSNYRFLINANLGLYNNMPDDEYLKRKFKATEGYELNLDNPKTFNEKLQWLKLYDRKDIYTVMADKYKMREFVKDKLGNGYTIPLLGVWDKPENIDFDKLPSQFVLKCNHNSGLGMCICKDKSKIDIAKVKKELKKGLKQNYYLTCREWPYKNIPRKIICEEYMDNGGEEALIDYKFFCFSGEPKIMYISNDGAEEPRTNFYDMDFNKLKIRMKDKNFEKELQKPIEFEKMKEIARKLSKGIKFLRVDFYYIKNKIYIGELTFYHSSGFNKIEPKDWDYKLGKYIKI